MGPTLRELARQAGVSPAAMSHALSGTGTLAIATRARLRAFAEERGYIARPALAALSALRGRRLTAAPMVVVLGEAIPQPTYPAAAAAFGYALRGQAVTADTDLDALAAHLREAGVAGLLISEGPHYRRCLAQAWDGLAVVAMGSHAFGVRHHTVAGSIAGPLAAAWSAVHARGWRRIGAAILAHEPWHPDDDLRLGAALAAGRRWGAPILPPPPGHPPPHPRRGAPPPPPRRWGGRVPPCTARHGDDAAILRWFRRERPDAVIGFSAGVRHLLAAHGLAPAFASLHLNDDDHRERDVAGLIVSARVYATIGMRQLDSAIRHHELGALDQPLLIVPPPQWRDGASLPWR